MKTDVASGKLMVGLLHLTGYTGVLLEKVCVCGAISALICSRIRGLESF